ncbi:MAG: type I-A CRISPR-associated protein Csa5 [Thermofilum sp. ex4484_79]|nr:MAG: type I-A CRISPR-associated protein Csa5 [Thermofilum sp. ex4484_79]
MLSGESLNSLKEFESVAVLLASVSIQSQSYSLIDRLANALSSDVVGKVLYEASRNLDTMVRRGNVKIEEKMEGDRRITRVLIYPEPGATPIEIRGRLPDQNTIEKFIEAAYKDINIARNIAAIAMNIVARAHLKSVG